MAKKATTKKSTTKGPTPESESSVLGTPQDKTAADLIIDTMLEGCTTAGAVRRVMLRASVSEDEAREAIQARVNRTWSYIVNDSGLEPYDE